MARIYMAELAKHSADHAFCQTDRPTSGKEIDLSHTETYPTVGYLHLV